MGAAMEDHPERRESNVPQEFASLEDPAAIRYQIEIELLALQRRKLELETREWKRPATILSGLTAILALSALMLQAYFSSAQYTKAQADATLAQAKQDIAFQKSHSAEAALRQQLAHSTAALRTTLAAAGRNAVQDVAEMHAPSDESDIRAKEDAAEWEEAWASLDKPLAALSRYAASLNALIDAGKGGEENAAAFVSSLQNLVDATGVAMPEAATKPVLRGMELIYGEVARQIAAGEIARGLEKADPAVAACADLISQDLANLRFIAIRKHTAVAMQLRAESRIAAMLKSLAAARASAATRAFVGQRDATALDELQKLNEVAGALNTDPEYTEFRDTLRAIDIAFAAQTDLLDQGLLTLRAWGEAHHNMVLALRHDSLPSAQDLSQFTSDLYELYKEYRAGRTKALK
jgi:hypothetical protein